MLITIAELSEFIRKAEKILPVDERDALLYHLSYFPKSGTLIKETGRIRKLRWASKGKNERSI